MASILASSGCVHVMSGMPAELEAVLEVAKTAADYHRHHQGEWPKSLTELCLSNVIIQSEWTDDPATERLTRPAQDCVGNPYPAIAGLQLEPFEKQLLLHFSPIDVLDEQIGTAKVVPDGGGHYDIDFVR